MVAAALALGTGTTLAATATARSADRWQTIYRSHTPQTRREWTSLGLVTAASRTDAWAAGITGYRNGTSQPDFLHWNGARWRSVSIAGTATLQPLAIGSTSPGDVWIFGTAHHSENEAVHLVSGTWQVTHTPAFSTAVAVLGSSDVWTIGQQDSSCDVTARTCTTEMLHWNGEAWSSSTIGTLIEAVAGWGGHVWAAGLTGLRGIGGGQVSGRLALYQWTGSQWQPFASAHPLTVFDPTIGSNATTIAAGPHGQLWLMAYPAHGRTDILRYWNGSVWTQRDIPAARTGVSYWDGDLIYDNAGGVWLGPFLHWTGSRWINTYSPQLFTELGGFNFEGAAAIPGSASIWATGAGQVGRMIAVRGRLP
jgi:hypothetical protein